MSETTLYFYSTNEPFGEFSNFSRHGIEMDSFWWPTVEHYFQAQKFEDAASQARIRTASDSKRAAELGRSRVLPLRADWEQIKDDIMARAVLQKFKTHRALRKLLLSTGDQLLVENAPGDYYWGCGKDGSGQNKLGQILEQVREHLRYHVYVDLVQVLTHLSDGYTRLTLVDRLHGGFGGGRYRDRESIWQVPTASIPPSLRRIGSRFVLEIDRFYLEERLGIEEIRDAFADMYRVRPLDDVTISDKLNPRLGVRRIWPNWERGQRKSNAGDS